MRQRIIASAGALALALMLLVNFKGPQDAALVAAGGSALKPDTATGGSPAGGTGGTQVGTGSTGGSGSLGSGGGTVTSHNAPPTPGPAGQFVGPMAADPYGDVEVQITVQAGKITDVAVLAMPVGGHSGRISNFVAPILRTQALTAQSARIDGVSGATYTSQAYAASLQGAIDKAGL